MIEHVREYVRLIQLANEGQQDMTDDSIISLAEEFISLYSTRPTYLVDDIDLYNHMYRVIGDEPDATTFSLLVREGGLCLGGIWWESYFSHNTVLQDLLQDYKDGVVYWIDNIPSIVRKLTNSSRIHSAQVKTYLRALISHEECHFTQTVSDVDFTGYSEVMSQSEIDWEAYYALKHEDEADQCALAAVKAAM